MAELLLINPAKPLRKRITKMAKKARRSRKAPTAKQRANWARFARMARARAAGRRPGRTTVRAARRRARNPVGVATTRRRRRNPINIGGVGRGLMTQVRDALIGGAGAVAMDLAYGQIARYLPASLQRSPAAVGLGDAVKAVATVVIGNVLSKPTRGMSRRMAAGALTVQAAELLRRFVPATMTMGYYSPARVIQGSARVDPIRGGMNAYIPGQPPLLNAYVSGQAPLLNGAGSASSTQRREGVSMYY